MFNNLIERPQKCNLGIGVWEHIWLLMLKSGHKGKCFSSLRNGLTNQEWTSPAGNFLWLAARRVSLRDMDLEVVRRTKNDLGLDLIS